MAQQSKANEIALDLVRQIAKEQRKVDLAQERTATTLKQPKQQEKTQSTVAPPIKGTDRKIKQVGSDRPPIQPPVKRSLEKIPDMAAIMKAAYRKLPDPPDWLAVGKRVHCLQQGLGEIEAILGARVVVKLDTGFQAQILEWSEAIESKRLTPEIEAFWTPGNAGEAPSNIEPAHWKELVEGSAIHPDLAQCNVQSVAGKRVYERLLSTRLEKIGSGQYVTKPAAKLMEAYEQVAEGGWWAGSGIDARSLLELKPGERPDYKTWGSFKADNPRVDASKSQRKGKAEIIKYEHPIGEERQLFLFEVPADLAEHIYNKHGIQPTETEKQSGFWHVVHKYNLPITITEGAKKTLSSLSQGEVTIGLSGVNGGYISRDEQKNRLEQRRMHPELKVFATPGREFLIAFDQDTKLSTIFNVIREMVRTGELLEQSGCTVRVVKWQGDKGLDDLIVNQGPLAYAQAQAKTIPLSGSAQKHYRGEYNRLSRQVRNSQPALTGEAVDIEVYKIAVSKGDIQDGARTIAQSDQSRSFRAELPLESAPEATLAYIQHLERQIYQSIKKTAEIRQDEITKQQQFSLVEQQPSDSLARIAQELSVAISGSTLEEQLEALTPGVAALVQSQNEFQSPTTNPASSSHEAIEPSIFLDNPQEPEQSHERTEQSIRTPECRQFPLLVERSNRAPDRAAPVLGADPTGAEHRPTAVARELFSSNRRSDRTPFRSHQEFGADPTGAGSSLDRIARELPEAISGAIELQEAQPLAGSVEELNGELEQRQFSVGGTKELGRTTQRHHESTNERLEQQQTGQLFNAIREHVELSAIDTAAIGQFLEDLTMQLNRVQGLQKGYPLLSSRQTDHSRCATTISHTAGQQWIVFRSGLGVNRTTQQLNTAITADLGQVEIPSLIAASSQPSTQRLSEAIANYVEEAAIESGPVVQALQSVSAQLTAPQNPETIKAIQGLEAAISNYLQEIEQRSGNPLGEQATQHLLDVIAEQVEQGSIDASGVSTALEELNVQLKQLQTNKITKAVEEVNTALSRYRQLAEKPGEATIDHAKGVVEAIADQIEQAAVESGAIIQALQSLSEQLKQRTLEGNSQAVEKLNTVVSEYLLQRVSASSVANHTQQALHLVEVISDYVEHSSVDSEQVVQAIEKLVTQINTIPTSEPTKSLKEVEAAISGYTHQLEANQTHSSSSVTENQSHSQLPQQVFVGNYPSPDKLMPISNQGFAYKPDGGIWTSPYHPQHGSGWAHFVELEELEAKSQQQQWLVYPKPDLKIFVVDSLESLKSLPHLPPLIPIDDLHPLNYEAIAQSYDALVVKQEVIRCGSLNEVYSFDIESTIWFGTRGWPFESVQLLESPIQTQETQPLQPSSMTAKPLGGVTDGRPPFKDSELETFNLKPKQEIQLFQPGVQIQHPQQLASLEVKQQPQSPQKTLLFSQQMWQQYSQRAKSPNPVSKQLEVARMAWSEGLPEIQIRQILQANPHLQGFGEKAARELVELPLSKVKYEMELLQRQQQASQQYTQEKSNIQGPEI